MKAVRLTPQIEKLLEDFALEAEQNQSFIIREAIVEYIARRTAAKKPAQIGAHLIGNYGSNDGSLSTTYKSKLKERLNEKFAR